jgi:hypothetical protein
MLLKISFLISHKTEIGFPKHPCVFFYYSVMVYRLNDPGSIPGNVKIVLHCVQTGTGAQPASYPVGAGSKATKE